MSTYAFMCSHTCIYVLVCINIYVHVWLCVSYCVSSHQLVSHTPCGDTFRYFRMLL
jgi:hypothetical protein